MSAVISTAFSCSLTEIFSLRQQTERLVVPEICGIDDFTYKEFTVALWLNNWCEPAWVDSELATIDARNNFDAKSISVTGYGASAEHVGQFEIEVWKELCENGRISDAVDALELLVQRGCHVPNNLFYRALKRCTKDKELAMGRRIHALSVKSGYEGDAFLATHLIGLYASHRKLKEAMSVFTDVPKPDVYNWATIILAYAKNGEAIEAIRLYRQMCCSTSVRPDDRIYSAVLKACASAGDLVAGKEVHAHITATPWKLDRFVQAGLVNMYAKCGNLESARGLFDKLSHKDVVTWTVMIAGYAQQGMGEEALALYRSMQHEGLTPPDCVTYVCLLQACAIVGVGAVDEGKQLHAQIRKQGLEVDEVLGGSLVNMYAKCGSLEDAIRVFDRLPKKNVVAWTAMLAGYAQRELGHEALQLYSCMQQEGLTPPNSVTYICLLQACAIVGVPALHEGRQLHAQIKEQGLQEDVVLGGSLVNMYAKCGSLEDACRVFDILPEPSIVALNAILAGSVQLGMGQEVLDLYRSKQQEGLTPNSVTYLCLLQACATVGVGALSEGKQLHERIKGQGLDNDVVVGGSLVNMYAKCGSLDDALSIFNNLSQRNVVAWTAIIAGYAQQGFGQKALTLYKSMQQEGLTPPNAVTYVCLLQACAGVGVGALHEGKKLHAQMIEQGLEMDKVLGVGLVNMYAKCGSPESARRLFDRLPERNVATWNAMIAGYVQQGMGQEALSLHSSMQQEGITPDFVTFVSLLQACAIIGVEALHVGKQLHVQVKERTLQEDRVVGVGLVNMYAKCSSLEDARELFERLPERDIVAWNAMLAGYSHQGMLQESFSLYNSLKQEGLTHPDSVTYVCLLQACATAAALPLGEQLHAEIEKQGLQADGLVGAALINMYAKCGSMYDSQRVFDSLPERGIEAWGALISGYARQGDSQVVFDLHDRMRLDGITPNEITCLSVLAACSHVGLVDKGRDYFQVMSTDFGISPTVEHFICMVDILGRAGHLDEALQMVKTMQLPASNVVWHTLLGACRKWKNVEIGRQAFQGAVSVDEKDAASYVLMSNIYASAQMWEEAKELQTRRKKFGAWKEPGQSSWTDMGGVVHTFLAGEKKHPESDGICARLEKLVEEIKKEGYAPHLQSSLLEMSDGEREAELWGHSEKLAIAFALNKTAEGTTIRIVKNLRVCEDCHIATAYISKVVKRTIICRDASRFHVFKEGTCSCGDYW